MTLRAILASGLLCTACVATHRVPVAPAPLQLSSTSAFRAYVAATDSTAATSCTMTAAIGHVRAIRGDTLEFSTLSATYRPQGQPDCTRGRPATIVVSESPQLRSVVIDPNHGQTTVAVLVLTSALGAVLFLYLMLTGMG